MKNSLLKRIIRRLPLLEFSVYTGFKRMTHFLAYLESDFINNNSEYTVLCIGRSIFNEDIEALGKYSGSLNYLIIQKGLFIRICNCFIPELTNEHQNYYKIKGFEHQKIRYQKFLNDLLGLLGVHANFHAILSANYNYGWQQELASVSKNIKLPFIVLFKEGISPIYLKGDNVRTGYDNLVSRYTNDNFIGDRLLVYNNRVKQAFLDSSIRNINSSMLKTVGIPRLDNYFQLKHQKRSMVFFSFNFEDKSRHCGLDDYEMYYKKTREFHEEIIKYALRNNKQQVIIKTKSNIKYRKYVEEIAEELDASSLDNLVITNQISASNLIKNAKAVIGYNSTVLLESYLSGCIVMTADFRWGKIQDFYSNYPNLPIYVSTEQDIASVMDSNPSPYPLNDQDLKEMLSQRVHTLDGRASSRTESEIIHSIKSSY